MTKIFITGVTGYIGGEALYSIATNPDYKISCLARDTIKGDIVKYAFPKVRIVLGDLDDSELIEHEAKDADIVLNLASTSHIDSANAIARGLSQPVRAKPGHWIQMSGATMVCADEIESGTFGEKPKDEWDDLRDVSSLRSLIMNNPKRAVDNLVIKQDKSTVRTALIVGPLIYGWGQGPVHQRSIQAPEIARVTLARKRGFRLGAGQNVWSNIHIRNLGALFSDLVEAAISGKEGVWNDEGLILPEHGAMTFESLCSHIAEECRAQGLVESAELDEITSGEADKLSSHASVLWGTNAVLHSSRAQKHLEWNSSASSLKEEIADIVCREAASAKSSHITR